jgi:two-component system NtrC family sensor kinase
MTLPLFPIWLVDFFGSALMIVFSFLCIHLARCLRKQDQNNIVWTYLLWLCYCLAAFGLSRSIGHIVKRALLVFGQADLWDTLQPYSGAINTLMFVVVASITLFFERVWRIYEQISCDKLALQDAHSKVLFLNRNLESLVEERTHELALSGRKYRRIFEVSPDMIAIVSGTGTIIDINPAGLKMLGLRDASEISRKMSFNSFFYQNDDWGSLLQTLQARGHILDEEIEMVRSDGSAFSTLLSGTTETDEAGSIGSIQFLVKDISHRKMMQRQLMQADKLASIGQLAAGIAHEVNNPLSMILGYTQLLLRDEDIGSQRHDDLKIIEKHAKNCKTIVGDLLSFSRSTRTKKEVSHLQVSIEEILSVVRHHFELDGVVVEKQFDPALPSMILDEEKIKQVFMNLIMNAKQAIGKKGTIQLSTHFDDINNQASIRISDTGTGIRPEHLSRIFDPFFTTKSTGEGTGLGLSVSYGIVKDHGGEILVESIPGKGSTFTVVLPVIRDNGKSLRGE